MLKIRNAVIILVIWIAVATLLLAVIEGTAAIANLGLVTAWYLNAISRASYLEFHSNLGWVNKPNSVVHNLYVQETTISIDEFGRRKSPDSLGGKEELNPTSVLCLGDSFTFGMGVSDNETWCHLLMATNQRLRTYNLGVEGYGFDQIFLQYAHNRTSIKHNIAIVAFIFDDFLRMLSPSFFGSPKPLLDLQDGRIKEVNTPLTAPYFKHGLVNFDTLASQLQLVKLINTLKPKVAPAADTPAQRALVTALVRQLNSLAQQESANAIFVLLPTRYDYDGNQWKPWHNLFESLQRTEGISYINLIPQLWKVSPQEVNTLFIQNSNAQDIPVAGHYSVAGNQFIALHLNNALSQFKQSTGQNLSIDR